MSDKIPKPTASTQEHLDIEDIIDDLIVLKTGWIALVMNTTAVNFDLLSEAEQDATIYAYGAFLNSLTFPIELLIRSKKADISAYFHALAEAEKVQPNPDLKRQIQKYEDFIQATVQQRTVLDKKFYIVITYSPAGTNVGLIGRKTGSAKVKGAVLEAAKASLFPRRDHVAKQLARLGLSSKQLSSQELVELLYDIYNPAPTGTQRIILDSTAYTAPLVEPAIENPAPAAVPQGPGNSGVSDNLIIGEAGRQAAGLMPHNQTAGQNQTPMEPGLRPAPPREENRGIGAIGGSEESEQSDSQRTGDFGGLEISEGQRVGGTAAQGFGEQKQAVPVNPPPSAQTPAQTDALQQLQKAVEEAAKLSGGISKTPSSGGLDLRGDSPDQNLDSGDIKDSGGFKL